MRKEGTTCMMLRAPAVPLITVDPYFSVWSMADKLNESTTKHWTGHNNTLLGFVTVDGKDYRFMGEGEGETIEQISLDINAMNTVYRFANDKIELQADFFTPLFPESKYYISRPVSYMAVRYTPRDGRKHKVSVTICASEELCLNEKGEGKAIAEAVDISGFAAARLSNEEQKPLNRSGDNIRIDWGSFYLAADGKSESNCFVCESCGMQMISATRELDPCAQGLFLFAYDDIKSIEYFGEPLEAYWKRHGKTIEEEIVIAASECAELLYSARNFSDTLYADAVKAGGEKYAELLLLSYRQIFASHKLVSKADKEILFISKECFSNGCAATADVSYPSIPFFLIYNPELVRGMLRPIFDFAATDAWPYDFAPHDVGQYPLLNGQKYNNLDINGQMPVEECGNMLIMTAAATVASKDASFAMEHIDTLTGWAEYLIRFGEDPENQLCTDDFAGHLAHNCNLSLKAISGLIGLSRIHKIAYAQGLSTDKTASGKYLKIAKDMVKKWTVNASNGDGSYRLAFDRPGSFSMKYNAVWDKLFGTDLFPKSVWASELATNEKQFRPYGMPLDNRAAYTKSDWLIWTATLAEDKDTFMRFIEPLWKAYHFSPSRVPMTDWYDTVTSLQVNFQHRSVIGGFFIKLLDFYGTMKLFS